MAVSGAPMAVTGNNFPPNFVLFHRFHNSTHVLSLAKRGYAPANSRMAAYTQCEAIAARANYKTTAIHGRIVTPACLSKS